jgi:hypothetical protein
MAVEYLESLVLDLLTQIQASYQTLQARRRDKQVKKGKNTSDKRKKLNNGESSQSQGSSQSHGGREETRPGGMSANDGEVGIVVKTRNRKTG